jgi:hypothetical protein
MRQRKRVGANLFFNFAKPIKPTYRKKRNSIGAAVVLTPLSRRFIRSLTGNSTFAPFLGLKLPIDVP